MKRSKKHSIKSEMFWDCAVPFIVGVIVSIITALAAMVWG